MKLHIIHKFIFLNLFNAKLTADDREIWSGADVTDESIADTVCTLLSEVIVRLLAYEMSVERTSAI